MTSSARESAAGLRSRLDARRDAPGLGDLPGELFAVGQVLNRDAQLRSALADAGQPAAARVALAQAIFGSRVSTLAVDVLVDVVAQRWPTPDDLSDAVEALAAQASFMVADATDELDRVEGELFRFSQALAESPQLQLALTDPAVPAAQKEALIVSLLAGRSTPQAAEVLGSVLSQLRGRRASVVLDSLMDLAAEQRSRSVAEVRVARPLERDQAARLAGALSRLHGRDVRLNVLVDPAVIGGIAVRIGNHVTDATVATRLEQARRALVG